MNITTPLIGREAEIDQIIRTLNDPTCQLLTLIGMGGIGKSRLAGQIFHVMKNLPNGVVWVSLETIPTAYDILPAIARHPHFDAEITSPQALLPYLRDKEHLIILDQYEHLLPKTEWLLPFLERCPKVKWLITSQVALNLSMEWQLMVQPLSADGEQSASVQLFAYHAGRLGRGAVMDTDNQTILQICDHLEGHPLAIQLVCRWLQTLSPQDILARLGTFDLLEARYADIPPRQRNLWGILRQLWELLPSDEQHLLSQLSFFDGDFSLEAILGCCDCQLVVVDSLVGRSLLIRQNERYRLHSLIRQFVYTHAPPDEAFIGRYSAYYLDIVIKHAGGIKDKRYTLTQRLFDVEYANIRKAWHNAIVLGDYVSIMESLHDFFLYIHTRGRNSDFTTWLTFALEHIPEHSPLWVWITFIQLYMESVRGDSSELFDKQVSLCVHHARRHKMTQLLPHLIRLRGDLMLGRNQSVKAITKFEEAETDFIATNDVFELARTWNRIGVGYLYLNDLHRARHYFHQSLITKRENHIFIEWVASLNNLAQITMFSGDLPEVKRLIAEMIRVSDEISFSTGRMQAHQLACFIAILERDIAYADEQQAHIQAKLAVASDIVRQFNVIMIGLIALLRQSPIEALTHLEAIHPTITFYRVWHSWAMGWAHSQLEETDKLYQQIHQLMPLTRHFNTDLFAFVTLWLCGKWTSQTRGDNALLAELATHPMSHYGIFEMNHAGTFLGTLQAKLERIAPQFEVTALPPSAPVTPLSDRETEILLLVAQEYSNQAIAEACHLTVGTVKVHLHRIYQKLGVENRSQAVRLAQSQRLLPLS